ncbi:glycoside hydrolase family 73 protein [Lacticaseibacillus saniviri]|uniref:Mannosyl-glycoprotein endo-beta-N-acetylglucosaminidase n=1 Tax=Lacticaseibacillus saniviri JCM 17471 = DSM 24301 TaxID=1293598 RepID=A0A0R2MSR4_9LACO|nr:glucosaminidase domain-containing protein [Lacticaseibacillus saniviri]KRO16614.1 mannosyl-glycoprotein endo-beta-N-acetylglucosaminidase [Lacticaseibacillus saniviri JCM 17471 = DSM 24301]
MASPSTFFAAIKNGAQQAWSRGVLPSVTAAQAAIESAWGTSQLALPPNNNLFGIKGAYNGQSVWFPTQEWSAAAGYYTINDAFRKYPDWGTSVYDHSSFFIDNSRYHNLLGVKDYLTFARLVQQDGYATAPNYADTIIATIEANGLAAWDQEAFNGVTGVVESWPHKAIDESVAQVVYQPGYGVNTYYDNGQWTGRRLAHGTRWIVKGRRVIKGQTMLLVGKINGGNEYLPIKYTNINDAVLTVNYTEGWGVNVYDGNGKYWGRRLKTGTQWRNNGTKTINGKVMYLVGNNTYLPKQYTQFGAGKP